MNDEPVCVWTGMEELRERAEKIAQGYTAQVLITGETGVGKEVMARWIHYHSPRQLNTFQAFSIAEQTPELLPSELFGHTKGAFTGAVAARSGAFRAAHGGTIFLDEIGDLPLASQVLLLRVLERDEVKPVGTETTMPVDVRVIAATHRDLRQEVSEGRFRQDLYFRLNAEKRLTADALEWLGRRDWPGNIRELGSLMERAVVEVPGETVDWEALEGLLLESERTHVSAEGDERESEEALLPYIKQMAVAWPPTQRARSLRIAVALKGLVDESRQRTQTGHQGSLS